MLATSKHSVANRRRLALLSHVQQAGPIKQTRPLYSVPNTQAEVGCKHIATHQLVATALQGLAGRIRQLTLATVLIAARMRLSGRCSQTITHRTATAANAAQPRQLAVHSLAQQAPRTNLPRRRIARSGAVSNALGGTAAIAHLPQNANT